MTAGILASFWKDVHYSLRIYRRNPGFAAVAVITLALGIGVNSGIFSILNGFAFKPLQIPRAGEVISVYQTFQGRHSRGVHGTQSMFSYSEYKAYRDQNHVFSEMLAYSPAAEATLGGDEPIHLFGQLTSCDYFDLLTVRPLLGRGFIAEECAAPGGSAVVVLSHELWTSRFGADPSLVGNTVLLNRKHFTVVGIAPPDFRGTEIISPAFWVPLTMQSVITPGRSLLADDNLSWLVLMGRLKPGMALNAVRSDLAIVADRIDQLYPGRKTTLSVDRASLAAMPEARTFTFAAAAVLLAVVGLVLLVACANVANLLLARAASRRKEIAIRLSVGAGRGRLVRQLLTESLVLAVSGGALGAFFAVWTTGLAIRMLISHLPHGVPPLMLSVGPDVRILGYAFLLTVITGVICGLAPAVQAARADLNSALKEDSSSAGSRSRLGKMLRGSLVGVQVAVCMVLLIGAGLMLRALYFAQAVDPGFEMSRVLTVSYDLRNEGYDDARAAVVQRSLSERLAALPGVESVAQVRFGPLSGSHMSSPFVPSGQTENWQTEFNFVSSGYFSLLGIPVVRGRDFTPVEVRGDAHFAIVTESTASRFWPGQDPIGKTVRSGDADPEYEIIGVVRDAQISKLGRSDTTYLYLPAAPATQLREEMILRAHHLDAAAIKSVRDAVRAVDPGLAVAIAPLEDNLEVERTGARIGSILLAALGGLALVLAATGVYGMVSFTVSRRVREIGIRMTLGASRLDVLRLVLRQAMRPVLVGAFVGLLACVGVSFALQSVLFGLRAVDPLAFSLVPVLLLTVALAACYLPARRAMRVHPMEALRHE